ncbi:hypothetical protein CWI75_14360 [Kineobactrum sediminis]|uniref:Sulfatase N-terminal domain-containing protein n=1 Tax=Kineobactrum sediminis TaxID=1905677 RepID=A0A2N5XZS6_9GAMM|nr:sulfatase-like hydrolase/transferase [Kineobactrum sediminis]PLW81648.1 hypothetical protein CWI75_14360 [Kineobactrum sediminis]
MIAGAVPSCLAAAVIMRGRPGILLLCLLLVLAACRDPGNVESAENLTSRPNIVLILLDDLGYGDINLPGAAELAVPNLAVLANEGVYFSRHYADSTCAASRAGSLTGTAPASHGFRPDHRGLSPEVPTLAKVLQGNGYSTHHVGKWHLGHTTPLAMPAVQGFDSFFGFSHQWFLQGLDGKGELTPRRPTYFNPWLYDQQEYFSRHEGHLSDILKSRAVALIRASRGESKPFFLNYWPFAPHSPLQPPADVAARYPDTPEGKYRAMVEVADMAVGAVMQALRESGLDRNTLLIVASDNGGTGRQQEQSNAPFSGNKGTYTEGGLRTPLLLRWPGVLNAGQVYHGTVTNLDYFPTIMAAARVERPAGLDGRDLRLLLAGQEREVGPLFWETVTPKYISWGALSADGRWRLYQNYTGHPLLYDLAIHPAGDTDVASRYPAIVAELTRQYVIWRQSSRELPVSYHPLDDRGKATLQGHSLQRTPGSGGFTFAIDLYPEANTQTSASMEAGERGEQVLALQKGAWSASLDENTVAIEMGGLSLRGELPAGKDCVNVAVTAFFKQSTRFPGNNFNTATLFIDGQTADHKLSDDSVLEPDDYLEPTYLGQDHKGERRFRGRLSRPLLYNEMIYHEAPDNSPPGRTIEHLLAGSCHFAEGTKNK